MLPGRTCTTPLPPNTTHCSAGAALQRIIGPGNILLTVLSVIIAVVVTKQVIAPSSQQLSMAQRYAFIAEWLDSNSGVLWKYQFFFYPDSNEVEMVRIEVYF